VSTKSKSSNRSVTLGSLETRRGSPLRSGYLHRTAPRSGRRVERNDPLHSRDGR
jgi:hypothetical protein